MDIIWPMGCKKIRDESELEKFMKNPSYAAQKKLDGVRCILHFMEDGQARYTTRGASVDAPSSPIEITHRLKHLEVIAPALPDTILDGELYSPSLTSAQVSGMISHRSTVPVDESIRLNVFDILKVRGHMINNMPWSKRMEYLEKLENYLTARKIIVVPFVGGEEHKRDLLSTELEAGREGVVFKNSSTTYRLGRDISDKNKPSNVWYKFKKKDTVDVRITGALPPEHYYHDHITNQLDFGRATKPWVYGWFGSISFVFEVNGVSYYGACSGISDLTRSLMSNGHHGIKPEFIGRWMEVEYMEKTSDGNLRHPRFVRVREEIEK